MRTRIARGVALGLMLPIPVAAAQIATQEDMWRSLEGIASIEVRLDPLDSDFERRFTLDRERIHSDLVKRLEERGVPVVRQRAEAVLHVKLAFLKVRDPLYVYSLEVSLHQAVQLPARSPFPTRGATVNASTWFRSHLGTTGELHSPEHVLRQVVDRFASDYLTLNDKRRKRAAPESH